MTRAGPPPLTKLAILEAHMAASRWREALKLAASFPRLGPDKTAITRGWEAVVRPDNYRQMGQDPATHVAAGITALQQRYRTGMK